MFGKNYNMFDKNYKMSTSLGENKPAFFCVYYVFIFFSLFKSTIVKYLLMMRFLHFTSTIYLLCNVDYLLYTLRRNKSLSCVIIVGFET